MVSFERQDKHVQQHVDDHYLAEFHHLNLLKYFMCNFFQPISPHRGFVIGQFGYQRLDVPISSVPPAYSQSEVSTREVPEIATVAHY